MLAKVLLNAKAAAFDSDASAKPRPAVITAVLIMKYSIDRRGRQSPAGSLLIAIINR